MCQLPNGPWPCVAQAGFHCVPSWQLEGFVLSVLCFSSFHSNGLFCRIALRSLGCIFQPQRPCECSSRGGGGGCLRSSPFRG